jgi:hypothetical protein
MDIGKEEPAITIEPAEEPFVIPAEEPVREPAKTS